MRRLLKIFTRRRKIVDLTPEEAEIKRIDDLIDSKLRAWFFHFDKLNLALRKKELYDDGCYHYEPGFSESALEYRRDEMKRFSAEIRDLEQEKEAIVCGRN